MVTDFVSTLLFGTGGHSLHEYTAVLSLPEVQEAFKDVPGFDRLNLENLFYTNNQAAFKSALKEAIAYNNRLLQRSVVREAIEAKKEEKSSPERFQDLEKKDKIRLAIQQIKYLEDHFEQGKKSEYFSSYRTGSKQVALMNESLDKIKQSLIAGDINSAKKGLAELSHEVETKFGKKAWFGFGNTNPVTRLLEAVKKTVDAIEPEPRPTLK